MSTISKTLLCIVGGMFFFMASSASQAETVAGTSELSIYGVAFDASGFRQVSVNVEYGYYFTDQIRGVFGLQAFGDDNDVDVGGRAGLVYDFRAQGNTMYLGAVANVLDFSDTSDTSYGYVYLGYRNYIGENTAFFAQGGYARTFRGSADAGIGEFGLTFFFN